jgi:ABC-type proline/glycine betaine transport system ATPase subunit
MKAEHIERKVAIMDIEKVLRFGLNQEMDPDESENFVKEFLQNIMEVNICVGT